MSFVKVYIHCVWGTKCRLPLLDSKTLRIKVWRHMRQNAISKGIYVDFISGYTDHCHCLVSLRSTQTLADAMKHIKGESSRWINENQLIRHYFEWQDEYYAVSVSESNINKVRDYIKNQEVHHRNKTFVQECEEMNRVYGFSIEK